jgi:hypothetical protein
MSFKLNFKKVFIALVFIFMGLLSIYFYVYKSHRDIATEQASYSLNAQEIISEFKTDFEKATTKYANQTIIIYGNITHLDLDSKIIMLQESISVTGVDGINDLKLQQKLTIKGRLVGYDDLLEEIVVDQSIILNTDAP